MSEQKDTLKMEEKTETLGLGKKIFPPNIDLCVQVAYARFIREYFSVFKFIEVPSSICRCECESVEVTNRTVTFTCGSVIICVELLLCLKFFPLTGHPYCQTFPVLFRRTIPFFKFRSFPREKTISLEEFQQAEGVCLEVEFIDCFCQAFPFDLATFIYVNLFFNLRVKLFQERNVLIRGEFFGGPVVKLPKHVNACIPRGYGEGNPGLEDGIPAGEDSFKDSLEKLPPEAKEQYETKLTEYMKKIKDKNNNIRSE